MDLPIDVQSLRPAIHIIPNVSTQLNLSDYLGAIKVRWGIGRNHYIVTPGLYKVGKPDSSSDVFVSANYKLSFDVLRQNLSSLNAWILVIDTKGVNVWCAAGKGTFGTDNLIKSIKNTSLGSIVTHHKIIVPQFGAVGVAAHIVKEQTGFKVIYGPVRAKDIRAFVQAGYKATPEMRKVTFTLFDRAKLIPVDLIYGKYRLLIAALVLTVISGLDRKGILFDKMWETSLFPLTNLFGAYIAGIVIAPLLLPLIPFRAFALKGAFWGLVCTVMLNQLFHITLLEAIALGLINVSIASFMTMNFTGSSTYTSLSRVLEQSQDGSELVRIPFIIPAAQPTPDLTVRAPNLQFRAHAPHSIQSLISVIIAFPWMISKTA